MANEKLLNQISTINRALGMIEGVSYGLTDSAGTALADAVQMIDETIRRCWKMENEKRMNDLTSDDCIK